MAIDTQDVLSPEQQTLLDALSAGLFDAPFRPAENVNWEAVLCEADAQTVLPHIFRQVSPFLPQAVQGAWTPKYLRLLGGNLRISASHGRLHTLLTDAGIPYACLKGCVSAQYYPEPGERVMGDVDFLIDLSDRQRTHELLLAQGFVPDPQSIRHAHHWTYTQDSIEWEMHWCAPGLPTVDAEEIHGLLDGVVQSARPLCVNGIQMMGPCALHHGLILLVHTANHLTAGGIGLRHLLDWLLFESSFSEEEFLSLFALPLKQAGLWQFARALTALGCRYFGSPDRAYCQDTAPALTRGLLQDIFDSGNFGSKDENRMNQAKLMRNIESRRVQQGGRMGNLISLLNRRAIQHLPGLEQKRVLLPVGWAYVGVKYLRRSARGEAPKLRLTGLLDATKERQQLYAQLKLYEH